jgi:hypothetical protein
LSVGAGAGGTLSACAIAITRQRAGTSRMPMTSRDAPLPGTVKRSEATRSPAARKRAATRACARRSKGEAAGRGPALARLTANACASAADGGGVAGSPAAVATLTAAMRAGITR